MESGAFWLRTGCNLCKSSKGHSGPPVNYIFPRCLCLSQCLCAVLCLCLCRCGNYMDLFSTARASPGWALWAAHWHLISYLTHAERCEKAKQSGASILLKIVRQSWTQPNQQPSAFYLSDGHTFDQCLSMRCNVFNLKKMTWNEI